MLHTYETDRLLLSVISPGKADAVADYLSRNRRFHEPWFPKRDDSVFTLANQKKLLRQELSDFEAGRALPLWLSAKDQPERIIGRFILSTMIRGAFQSAILSYHLDESAQGKGLAYEAGQTLIEIAFDVFELHRIEANILPRNERSIALVQRLGFELEGLSRRYLQIAGHWADHLHYVCLSDGPVGQAADEPVLRTERILVRPIGWPDLESLLDYQVKNQDHLASFNPQWTADSKENLRKQFCDMMLSTQTGHLLEFGMFLPDRPKRLIGLLHVRNLQHLPFSSCELGFSIDRELVGQGLAFEALSLLVDYLVNSLGLHRIAAYTLENNQRSRRLLERLGFIEHGREFQAVYAEGIWQDLLSWYRLNV